MVILLNWCYYAVRHNYVSLNFSFTMNTNANVWRFTFYCQVNMSSWPSTSTCKGKWDSSSFRPTSPVSWRSSWPRSPSGLTRSRYRLGLCLVSLFCATVCFNFRHGHACKLRLMEEEEKLCVTFKSGRSHFGIFRTALIYVAKKSAKKW